MKDILRSRFDEIIGRNFERLTGTKQGIGGLPLNIATIGCFILLGGREIEIENTPANTAERYTRETFLEDAAGLGVERDEYLETGLRDMIERGYLGVDSKGRLIAQESTLVMTRVLDRIFPKMKGINLLAYIGQTVEEALTGRTDMEAAASRFDQTLKHHGIPFSAQRTSRASLSASSDTTPIAQAGQQDNRKSRDEILAGLYSRAKTSEPNITANTRPNRVLAGGAVLRSVKVADILPKDEKPPECSRHAEAEKMEASVKTAGGAAAAAPPPINAQVIADEIEINSAAEEPDLSVVQEAVSDIEQRTHATLHDSSWNDDTAGLIQGKEEDDSVDDGAQEEGTIDDDEIAAFEKDLSFTCPICKTNVLTEQSTGAGNKYYTCPSGSCNFISWGKPHHVECRRCKNHFLIEVADASGDTILKCPRAACQHRQSLNPKLVKVVRKRVVRRKR